MSGSDEHRFGGSWTEIKLAVLDSYSGFFSTALKFQNFDLWYIDGFAGTGRRTQVVQVGGLFEGEPLEIKEVTLEGSARKALAVQPPYHHVVLIEDRKKHFAALEQLAQEHPARQIRPICGDANQVIPELLMRPPWVGPGAAAQRALVFLDPYGINVHFDTLRSLAVCGRADVWLLVNLKAVFQQLARNHDALDQSKREAVSRFLGTSTWEDEFYAFQERGDDLFSMPQGPKGARKIDKSDVARFYRTQLQGTFNYVSDPLPLKVGHVEDYFQLYCMSNNSSPNALALIKCGAESVLKKFAKASRHTSAH